MGPRKIHCPLKPYFSPLPAGITPNGIQAWEDQEWLWVTNAVTKGNLGRKVGVWAPPLQVAVFVSLNQLPSPHPKHWKKGFVKLFFCPEPLQSVLLTSMGYLPSSGPTQRSPPQGSPSRFLVLSRYSDFIDLQRFLLFLSKCTTIYNHVPSYLIVCSIPDSIALTGSPMRTRSLLSSLPVNPQSPISCLVHIVGLQTFASHMIVQS